MSKSPRGELKSLSETDFFFLLLNCRRFICIPIITSSNIWVCVFSSALSLNIMHFIESYYNSLWVYLKIIAISCYEQIDLMDHYLYLFWGPVIHVLISPFACDVLVYKMDILSSFSILLHLGSSKWESFC